MGNFMLSTELFYIFCYFITNNRFCFAIALIDGSGNDIDQELPITQSNLNTDNQYRSSTAEGSLSENNDNNKDLISFTTKKYFNLERTH